jgi:hypothetical protein
MDTEEKSHATVASTTTIPETFTNTAAFQQPAVLHIPETPPTSTSSSDNTLAHVNLILGRSTYTTSDAKDALARIVVSCPEHATGEPPPRANSDMVVVVDTSGSMADRMEMVQRSVAFILRCFAGKPGRVGIVCFNEEVSVIRELAAVEHININAECQRVTNQMRAQGCTDLAQGLLRGLDMLGQTNRVRAMVVVSDGVPTIGECVSKAISKRVIAHPATSDAMIFALAIGNDCDTKLLHRISSRSAGGSLFEITRHGNPATVLGAMTGIICYQRIGKVAVTVRGKDGIVPRDCCGIQSDTDALNGTRTYRLGNMAAGERRVLLCQLDVSNMGDSVRASVEVTGVSSLTGADIRETAVAIGCIGEKSAARTPVVEMEWAVVQALDVMANELDLDAMRRMMQRLRSLGLHYASSTDGEEVRAYKRVKEVADRIGWVLEIGNHRLERARLIRTATTDLAQQRCTTYQATQEARHEEKTRNNSNDDDDDDDHDDHDGNNNDDLPDQLPAMIRGLSQSATAYSQDEGDNMDSLPELQPFRRTMAMGSRQVLEMLNTN